MLKRIRNIILALVCLSFIASPAFAMSEAQTKEFDRIANLSMPQLTEEAAKALEKKYPNEDWTKYDFPQFVYTSDSTETAYKIAVKEPGLLSKITCYCFCDRMGHQSLLYCFFKEGKAGGEFDRHASGWNICYGEAMVGFLWSQLGASEREINQGIEKKFKLKK